MASPQIEVFAVYNSTTGAPLTGQAPLMSFTTYKDDLGSNILPVPSISEIGATGIYKFTPTLPASSARGLVYQINMGAGAIPAYVSRYVRAEDWYPDDIQNVRKVLTNKYRIDTALNQLIIYDDDGTTALYTFDLQDGTGAPSITNILRRNPV